MSLVRPTRSIRLLQTDRTCEDSLRGRCLKGKGKKNLYDNGYLASFGGKLITHLIQLIGSTRRKFGSDPTDDL